jgi:hypothetical protein
MPLRPERAELEDLPVSRVAEVFRRLVPTPRCAEPDSADDVEAAPPTPVMAPVTMPPAGTPAEPTWEASAEVGDEAVGAAVATAPHVVDPPAPPAPRTSPEAEGDLYRELRDLTL